MYKVEDISGCIHCNKEAGDNFYCSHKGIVYETEKEWKRYLVASDEKFKKRMGGHAKRIQISSFEPFESPIDGSMITGTKSLEDHNRAHGVQQVGHEYENRLNKQKGIDT